MKNIIENLAPLYFILAMIYGFFGFLTHDEQWLSKAVLWPYTAYIEVNN